MATWKPAPSVAAALKEANRLWPKRDRASDGTIGDTGHQARPTSDHNPDSRGVVHAFDLTDDPVGGGDCDELAALLVKRRDPRVRYIIWNRRICLGPWADSVQAKKAVPWVWGSYNGVNAHKAHMHVSVGYAAAPENDVSPWWATSEQGEWDQMASKAELAEVFDARLKAYFGRIVGGGQISFERTIENTLRVGQENINETRQTRGEVAELRRLFEAFLLKQGGSENPTGDIS